MGKKSRSRTKNSIFKRFIGNRNTVTILGIAACIGVLIIGYNYRVNQAMAPISVPYAKKAIPSRTLITSDMVGRIKVTSTYANDASNLVKSVDEVVNKYVSYKTNIPKGSLFYTEQLKEANEMPDSAFANIEDGYTIYSLDVSLDDTYANSIRAGDYIDLYMSTTDPDSNNMIIYSKFIESIRVLQVKDGNGNNILGTGIENGQPSELIFAVKDDMYELLMCVGYIQNPTIKLKPALSNTKYTAEGNETLISSQQLHEFIKKRVSTTLE